MREKHALVVSSELTAELINIAEQELSKLQIAVGGLIEAVDLTPEITMWVNEEGLLLDNLEPNLLATAFMAEIMNTQTPIMGDVVFTGGIDEEGDTKSLTQANVAELVEMTRKARESLFI
jgi:hypothetical protein